MSNTDIESDIDTLYKFFTNRNPSQLQLQTNVSSSSEFVQDVSHKIKDFDTPKDIRRKRGSNVTYIYKYEYKCQKVNGCAVIVKSFFTIKNLDIDKFNPDKMLTIDSQSLLEIYNEIAIQLYLTLLRIPNVVKCLGFYYRNCDCSKWCKDKMKELNQKYRVDAPDFIIYKSCQFSYFNSFAIDMLLEYYPKGDLTDFMNNKTIDLIDSFRQNKVEQFVIENRRILDNGLFNVYGAIVAIHGKKILHFDIKPENIYLGENAYFNVGDFGASYHINTIMEALKDNKYLAFVGTADYLPPEIETLHKERPKSPGEKQMMGARDLTEIVGRLDEIASQKAPNDKQTFIFNELAKFDYYALGVMIIAIVFFYLFGVPISLIKTSYYGMSRQQQFQTLIGTSNINANDLNTLKNKLDQVSPLNKTTMENAKVTWLKKLQAIQKKIKVELNDNIDRMYIYHCANNTVILEMIASGKLSLRGFIKLLQSNNINDPYFKYVDTKFADDLLNIAFQLIADADKRNIQALHTKYPTKLGSLPKPFQQTAGDSYYHKYLKYKKKYLALKARLSHPRISSL